MKKIENVVATEQTPEAAVRPAPRYEPPRIVSRRSVERVTLLSGTIDPGPGGPPIGGE